MEEKLVCACYECGSDLGEYDFYYGFQGRVILVSKYCDVCGRDVSPVLMAESEAEMRKNRWIEKRREVGDGRVE